MEYQLKITNMVTKKETVFTDLNDMSIGGDFYQFKIELPKDMEDGEYEWLLYDSNGGFAGSGLMVIGDYIDNKNEYEGENPIYNVYGE